MCEVKLYFSRSGSSIRLSKIESRFGPVVACAMSESLALSQKMSGTFRWSRGVRAMSILMLRSFLACLDSTVEPRLSGGSGSIAATLDSALSKEPAWLIDSFGVFPGGMPVSRRLFARSNPGRKRIGPVAVSLVGRVKGEDVEIYVNGRLLVECCELRSILAELENQDQSTI